MTNNYRIVRHTIIKSEFQKFRQPGLKIACSLDFHMLIKPPRNILRSICYMNDSSRNGLDLNWWGKNYTIAYRQSLIPNQVSKRSMVVFQRNARAQCLANGATFI